MLSPASLVLVAFGALLTLQPPEDGQSVRVRLMTGRSVERLTVVSQAGPIRVFNPADNRQVARVERGDRISIEARDAVVRIRWGNAGALLPQLRLEAEAEALALEIDGKTSRYRGALEIGIADGGRGLLLVNDVDLEAYVASVLPSEYPFTEIEGAKAQAVATRTYGLAASRKFGDEYDLSDDVQSQVYRGLDSETDLSRRAALETAGEVILYGGALVEAVYSASNGGHTAANADVWEGTEAPYLAAKPDPFDRDERYDTWSATLDADRLLSALSRAYDTRAEDVRVTETSEEGRAITLEIEGRPTRTVRAGPFRSLVNQTFGPNTARSTFFTIRRRGNRYELEGRGYGHGVGLSQIGARNRARAGQSYEEILAFYFDGTSLAQLPEAAEPPVWLAERVERPSAERRRERAEPVETDAYQDRERRRQEATPQRPRIWHNRAGTKRVGW